MYQAGHFEKKSQFEKNMYSKNQDRATLRPGPPWIREPRTSTHYGFPFGLNEKKNGRRSGKYQVRNARTLNYYYSSCQRMLWVIEPAELIIPYYQPLYPYVSLVFCTSVHNEMYAKPYKPSVNEITQTLGLNCVLTWIYYSHFQFNLPRPIHKNSAEPRRHSLIQWQGSIRGLKVHFNRAVLMS